MLIRGAKAVIKALGAPVIDAAGVYRRRIDRLSAIPGSWTIVMYHRIVDDLAADPFRLGMCVRRDRFEQQIRYLRSRFHVLGVSEGVERLRRGEALPARALSVTFDDGYLDNLTHALPVMRAHGVPYALFVPTGGLDDGEMLWWDRVIAAVACTERESVDLVELGLASRSHRVSLARWRRTDVVRHMLDRLWELPSAPMREAVRRIERALAANVSEPLHARRLTSEQVRQLHRHGVEIGAHSVGHPNLALASAEETRDELLASRRRLEALLQAEVPGLAYPGGRMGAETVRVARELDFRYALATRSGSNIPPLQLYELRRVGMPDAPIADFRRAISVTLGGERPTSQQTF